MAIKIIQGATKIINIDVVNETTKRAFDMTGFSEIVVCIVSGTTKIELTETGGRVSVVGDAKFGQLTLTLTAAETTSLPQTSTGNIEVVITQAGPKITKTQALNSFIVLPKLCDD